MPEGHDTTIEVSKIMSFVLYTQICKKKKKKKKKTEKNEKKKKSTETPIHRMESKQN